VGPLTAPERPSPVAGEPAEPPGGRWPPHRLRVRPHATLSGALLAGAGAPLVVASATFDSFPGAPLGFRVGAIALVLLLFATGLVIPRSPRHGRRLASLGALGLLAIAAPRVFQRPVTALAAVVATAAALAWLWRVGGILLGPYLRREPIHAGQTRGAALAASGLWFLAAFLRGRPSPLELAALAFALAVATALLLEWSVLARAASPVRALALRVGTVLTLAVALAAWGHPWAMVSAGAPLALAGAAAVRRPPRFASDQAGWWEPWLGHPERLFVGTFAALCILGMLLLALPHAATTGRSIGPIDALFTAVSAVCVTGLIVKDTPVDFTPFGQLAILFLIQVGGLGIMTFSTAAIRALGRRMSLRHEGAVASLISTHDRGALMATTRRILTLTFAAEGLGALLLFFPFRQAGDSVLQAAWRSLFTSVSAFCNAGFALQTDSLVPYRGTPVVLHVVAALIVLGGLSPGAVLALGALRRRRTTPLPAQAKLALAVTAALLATGTGLYLSLEWSNTLGGLGAVDRFHNAWFQSVTLRTAGFNSVDVARVHPATLTLMMIWMMIGGCPGGTAGGIKTTTAALLLLSVLRAVRGQPHVVVFGRRIAARSCDRAEVAVTLAVITFLAAVLALQVTQALPTRAAVFEVVSALGTVGLSVGGTAALDGIGKIVILLCMFVGRVGGVTLLMFLSQRRPLPSPGRPEEEIDVG